MMKEISIWPKGEFDTSRKYAASRSSGSRRRSIWKKGIFSGHVILRHSLPAGFRNDTGSILNICSRRRGMREDRSRVRSSGLIEFIS